MSGADAITVVVCVFFGAAALSLFVEPAVKALARRSNAKAAAEAQVLAQPVKLPVTRANRAMRARRANVVWSLPPAVIADKLGPYDAEMADCQHLADLFADEVDR